MVLWVRSNSEVLLFKSAAGANFGSCTHWSTHTHTHTHTHTRFNDTPLLSTGLFSPRRPICLRVDPTCIKPQPAVALSLLFFPLSSGSPVRGPPRPGARLRPREVGWWSQQGPRLRHTISMRELESLQLEGQRRTSPSLCKRREEALGSCVREETDEVRSFVNEAVD